MTENGVVGWMTIFIYLNPTSGPNYRLLKRYMTMTKETNDTEKLIEVLEEELTYIRGECERWHTLYVEEAKARKNLERLLMNRAERGYA